MDREELRAWLRLQLTPGVGDVTARKLLTQFGLPDNVFKQSADALRQVTSALQATALLEAPPELEALVEVTWNWLQAEPGCRYVLPTHGSLPSP